FGVAGGVITVLLRSDGFKFSVPTKTLGSVVGFVGYNLAYSFARPNVDIAGHIGGLVVGLLLGAMSQRRVTDDAARLTVPSLTAALAMALVIGYGAHRAQRLHPSLAALGHTDRAIADYAAVIRLAPRAAVAHYNLGIAYARRGDGDSARAEFEQALANATDDTLRRDAQNALTHLARASPPRLPVGSV